MSAIIEQLNAHPNISKAALSKHEPAIRWGMDADTQTAVRAVVSKDEWPDEAVIILFADDELLNDIALIRNLILSEAEDRAKERYQ